MKKYFENYNSIVLVISIFIFIFTAATFLFYNDNIVISYDAATDRYFVLAVVIPSWFLFNVLMTIYSFVSRQPKKAILLAISLIITFLSFFVLRWWVVTGHFFCGFGELCL